MLKMNFKKKDSDLVFHVQSWKSFCLFLMDKYGYELIKEGTK